MHDNRVDRRAFLGSFAAYGIAGLLCQRQSWADEAKPDPVGLAKRVESLYASCKSYRDTGQASQIARHIPGEEQVAKQEPRKIKTAFVRPDKFRFEFDEERDGKLIRNLIRMDGDDVKSWWDMRPGIQTPKSLSFALSAAAGVTESSSVTISPLLLAGKLNRPHALSEGPGELSLLADETIGQHGCHRLRRRFEAFNPQARPQDRQKFEVIDTYWIDAKTFAIRRVVKEMEIGEGRSIGTLELEPEFDVEIPLVDLAFDPPEAKQ